MTRASKFHSKNTLNLLSTQQVQQLFITIPIEESCPINNDWLYLLEALDCMCCLAFEASCSEIKVFINLMAPLVKGGSLLLLASIRSDGSKHCFWGKMAGAIICTPTATISLLTKRSNDDMGSGGTTILYHHAGKNTLCEGRKHQGIKRKQPITCWHHWPSFQHHMVKMMSFLGVLFGSRWSHGHCFWHFFLVSIFFLFNTIFVFSLFNISSSFSSSLPEVVSFSPSGVEDFFASFFSFSFPVKVPLIKQLEVKYSYIRQAQMVVWHSLLWWSSSVLLTFQDLALSQ